ncbi:GNAT family N-acetyltransferase [Streptomyces sp. AJS327]|uniref:GNAT family N-acetyltransferase n=1 Tax=Streptomyces sp. AJS327 TaxID=2545265 RepID=UPI0015DD6F1D|nr:GNAT family N-acetyltransferase [Streptomyces sp. AJS327]MBA0053228.1 GNAT family N-acetyltransferase [Streptomyces sp. AJS327]
MVTVEPATPADVAIIATLLGEIAVYYGGEDLTDERQVEAALFGDRPLATVLLAREATPGSPTGTGPEDGGPDAAVPEPGVLGFASYTYLWPASGRSSMFLKELFVRGHARRRGVAGALMTELRKLAADFGCARLEWTADRDNPAALGFYEALGAEEKHSKVFYRVEP